VLTGSANLLMMHQVGDSLDGRAAYLRLGPLTRREALGLGETGAWTRFFETPRGEWLDVVRADPAPAADWRDTVRRGGFPSVAIGTVTEQTRALWFDGYVATYLERDLRDLKAVSNLQEVTHYRTVGGVEIDFVAERRGALLAIEVKSGGTPTHRDAARLNRFVEEMGSAMRGGVLLHDGDRAFWLTERVLATPWWTVA
jgi:predicted AAA+ superfamily ATPase